mmetsp:Transcript_6342/g.9412  ORF Transcript_6342/g.9412 Transcript_6342/m.9412 type:complete len:316 (+) Transcript_6342:329-1276(+)
MPCIHLRILLLNGLTLLKEHPMNRINMTLAQKKREKQKLFLTKALKDPLYGQADIVKWRKKLLEGSSPATICWCKAEGIPSNNCDELKWSSFVATLEKMDNCVVFLDATWSFDSSSANKLARDLAREIHCNPDVQKIFPNVRIVHISYCDWEPRQTAFKSWWMKQFATRNDAAGYDYYSGYGCNSLPQFLHCCHGKIKSVVRMCSHHCGDAEPPNIAESLRLLYLFSFGGQRHPREPQVEPLTDNDTCTKRGWIKAVLWGGTVQVSPHESKDSIIPALEPIAAMHSVGNYFVGEQSSEGHLLERIERFPPRFQAQ